MQKQVLGDYEWEDISKSPMLIQERDDSSAIFVLLPKPLKVDSLVEAMKLINIDDVHDYRVPTDDSRARKKHIMFRSDGVVSFVKRL